MRILLSAGHGSGFAHNRGAICYNEGDNNYNYSIVLAQELRTYGASVDLVRMHIDDNPHIHERAAMGVGYDLFLDLHSNAASPAVRGTEVWDSVERPNYALAKLICDMTAEFFNHNNRGVKYKEGVPGYNWYGVLRFNLATSAMIIETGFHTNREDCGTFLNSHSEIAKVQARAIASHYGLKKQTVHEPVHWKKRIVMDAYNAGIIRDVERWMRDVDQPMPVWAVLQTQLNTKRGGSQ